MVFNGSEHFIANGEEISVTMSDFWKWSYPDFLDNSRRNTLSKFIRGFVHRTVRTFSARTALLSGFHTICLQAMDTDYKSKLASYLQSQDEEHPDFISYPINGMTDAYVFSLYKATSPSKILLILTCGIFL